MTYALHTIPCLTDNYAYALVKGDHVAIFDAPEAGPIEAWLDAQGLSPDVLLLTHHHPDHVAGTEALRARGAEVWGAEADAHRLPDLDRPVSPGVVDLFGDAMEVIDVPGHTIGHVAYHVPAASALFTGDTLMALGCGRLFEGTPAQMWESLGTLAKLPGDTQVCSGHEYAATNARFALNIDPDNTDLAERAYQITEARRRDTPTVPVPLDLERRTNPFLRANSPAVKSALDMADASDIEVFAAIRAQRDAF